MTNFQFRKHSTLKKLLQTPHTQTSTKRTKSPPAKYPRKSFPRPLAFAWYPSRPALPRKRKFPKSLQSASNHCNSRRANSLNSARLPPSNLILSRRPRDRYPILPILLVTRFLRGLAMQSSSLSHSTRVRAPRRSLLSPRLLFRPITAE